MVKDYWYMIALGAAISIVTISLDTYVVVCLYFIWLLYLFLSEKIQLIVFMFSLFSFFFFYFYIPIPESFVSSTSYEDQTHFTGEIVSSISQTDKKLEFTFQDNQIDEKFLVVYFIETDEKVDHSGQSLTYGASCLLNGEISIPDKAHNPHQFDYRLFLQKQGIPHHIIIPSLANITCQAGESLMRHMYDLRTNVLSVTAEKLEPVTTAWLHALVFGNDSLIDDDTIELFQRWSLSHILAISGLHVGIVVGIIYLLLVRFQLTTKEQAQWIVLLFLPLYAMLAGGQPSVWRASLMILLVILLNKIKLKYSYADIISIVFLCMMLIDKHIVYQIGFQLSFAVTFGLILSNEWISQSKTNMERIFQISFISQMIILPLQVYYFSTFQPLSILLNVIIVPYFSLFVIPALFLLLIVMHLPTFIVQLFEAVFLNVHLIVIDLLYVVDTYVNFPFIIGDFSLYATILYYIVLLMMMVYLEKRDKVKSFQYGLLITFILIVIMIRPYFSPVGTVTMLDMGQGDTFVIELPYRKGVFFIDAGATFTFPDFEPSDRVYKQVIKPYLYGQGIVNIDTIFISHDHIDHHGSVPLMIEEFNVGEIVISPYHDVDNVEMNAWTNANIAVNVVHLNDKIVRNGQAFHVLAPANDKKDENENSIVLYTELGGARWLFTGDIGKVTEREMMRNFSGLNVDVLKVGHHGSDTSTDPSYIDEINPTYALISAGLNNSYGHPADEVIQTLADANVIVYRTDLDGAIQYYFKDNRGFFKRFIDGK